MGKSAENSTAVVPREKLSQRFVDRIKVERTVRLREGVVPGLSLLARPAGNHSWQLSYRFQQKPTTVTLGSVDELSLLEARDLASQWRKKIRLGVDPQKERKAREGRIRLSDAIDDYLNDYCKKNKKSWRKDEIRLKKHVGKELGAMFVDEINPPDMVRLYEGVKKSHPYQANRLIENLRHLFNRLIRAGVVDRNPCVGVKNYKEQPRERILTDSELKRLWVAASQEDKKINIYVRKLVQLLLLTGLRKNELLTAKWNQVYWDSKQLYLPETKSGKERTIELNNQSIQILKSIPYMKSNPYIFCGRRKKQALKNVEKPWEKLLEKSNISDFTLHDLRRTAGSLLVQSGVPLEQIAEVLGHSATYVTQRYAKLDRRNLVETSEKLGELVMAKVSKNK